MPEYWVVDVNARIVHRLFEPKDGAYARRSCVGFGEELTAITISTLTVNTTGL